MTIQTVLNVTQTALVIDTAGHLLGSREPYLYDDGTISAANFAILQAHLNSGRLRLLTGGVTIPSPSQGASFVSVAIQGQNLVFTDSLGGTSTVAVPGADVDLSEYAKAVDVSAALATKVNSSTYTAGLAGKIDTAALDAYIAGLINSKSGSIYQALVNYNPVVDEPPGYDIIFLIGQSNMSGRGKPIDGTLDASDARVFQYGSAANTGSTGAIVVATDPLLHHDYPSTQGVGPGLTFAKQYAASRPAQRKVLLIPAAHGGTALSTTAVLGWRSTVSGNLYAQAVSQYQAALNVAGAGTHKVIAALWVQGEQDGADGVSQTTYAADLDALIAKLRTDTNSPDMAFIVGQMVPEFLPRTGRLGINSAHREVGSRVTRAAFAPYPGPYNQNNADGNHYNSPGNRALGASMYATFARLIAGTTQPVLPNQLAAPTGVAASAVTSTSLTVSATAVTGASVYTWLRRAGTSGTFDVAGTSVQPTFNDSGLTANTAYQYQAYAINAWGPSAASTTLSVSTLDSAAPQVPGAPVVTASGSDGSVIITGSASGATSFDIYRGPETGAFGTKTRLTAGTGVASLPFSDTTAVNGTTYFYQVVAKNAQGSSAASNEVSATPQAAASNNVSSGTLNQATAPAMAYSTRRVVTGYSGPVMKVRRSSDNVTQDIAFTAGGVLDATALLAFAGADSVSVDTWYDQSGNARHLTAATTIAQPTIVSAGVIRTTANGQTCLVFDGSDDVLSHTNPALYAAGAATSAVVLQGAQSSSASRAWIESNATLAGNLYGLLQPTTASQMALPIVASSDTSASFPGGTAPAGTIAAYNGVLNQMSGTDTGTTLSQFVNGAADITEAAYTRPGSLTAKNRFAVGGMIRNGTLSPAAIRVTEAVFWTSVLSPSNRQTVEATQKAFFKTP